MNQIDISVGSCLYQELSLTVKNDWNTSHYCYIKYSYLQVHNYTAFKTARLLQKPVNQSINQSSTMFLKEPN
jgi:hypothetical protein